MNLTRDHDFSIIMPTFQEAKNIPELIQRIAAIDFGKKKYEVIIVDDNSKDGTVEIVQHLKSQYAWLKLIVRQNQKGLCQSILEGIQVAAYPTLVIMDADLSHPPEKIPTMLAAFAAADVELVIGSRYIAGGTSDATWPMMRKALSRLAVLFTRPLIGFEVKDPLSGFLAIKKETVVRGSMMRPIGWKIGLELMVKCRIRHIQEIPIHFSERKSGVSKLNIKVVLSYLQHIGHLMWFKWKSGDYVSQK